MKLHDILSHDAGPFWQFVKYGACGVMATCVQVGLFYSCAATFLQCLSDNDWSVHYFGLPAVVISDTLRAFRAAVATSIGFTFANVFCWLMNRWFVFRPGKFRWYIEFAMFFGVSTLATIIALGVQSALISWFGLMTSAAVFVEIVVSFFVNFFIRKFFIFKN